MNILLLDDVDCLRLELKKYLEFRGHAVHDCKTSSEAYSKIKALGDKLDVMIIDIHVPSGSGSTYFEDGLDLCRVILQDLNYDIYTVVLSGYIKNRKVLLEGNSYGVDDFILKPFEYERVLSSITKTRSD